MDPSQNPLDDGTLNGKPKPGLHPIPDERKTENERKLAEANAAVDLIRRKLDTLYAQEPDAKEELQETEVITPHRSKHQAYMHKLSTSGSSLAEIQTKWHEYYTNLPDVEKHEVWQEFYKVHEQNKHPQKQSPEQAQAVEPSRIFIAEHEATPAKPARTKARSRTTAEIKRQLLGTVQTRSSLKRKHHLQSLGFGLAVGMVTLLIFLFGFFNERIIAPFITPSRNVSNTPIIVDPNNTAVGPEPKVIIPKINVEIPLIYGLTSVAEQDVQKALEGGALHYATTAKPGEQGNAAVFGHSSNNIFNSGKYKFAFVMLNKLEPGDTFYLTRDGTRYTYKVYEKKIVKPTDTWVLGNTDKPATATLITCDPPGTSINRLVVFGEQISPSPTGNVASSAVAVEEQPTIVPGNAPSLWQRIKGWFTS